MRAAEWEAKCLVIGGGNLQRGAWRLTLMERRAALAIESAKPARVAGRGRSQRPQGDTAPNGAASPMRDSAASSPSGRTLRRREGRRKRRERETTAASDKASGQTEAATPAANADGAERGAVGMEVAEQAATPRTVPAKASEPSRGAVGDSGRSRSADRMGSGCAAACPTAAGGADAGADEAVRGAQAKMAQLLPPSLGASSTTPRPTSTAAVPYVPSGWTVLGTKGLGHVRGFKRPASRPASKLASPEHSAQVGPA